MQDHFPQPGEISLENTPGSTSAPVLLVTKLALPPIRSDLVARPRLINQLHLGIQRPLPLIAAPAGFGKTTILRDWLQEAPVLAAWVSLEHEDDDLARFWSYVFTALERVQPGSGASALGLLYRVAPQSLPPIETILTIWINGLAILSNEVALMLDNYHLITAPAIHHSVIYLLDHLPSHLHLVIATRADPPLPLARLRARGQLTEMRAADLRFTAEETTAFMTRALGRALAAQDIAVLEARTEGWVAGLQLVGLAMQGRQDFSAFLASFTGSHHYIIDYLVEEVLARLPESVQTFLLHTAILERLQGSLCEAVLGESGEESSGQALLEQMEQANLFLTPLDEERRWYRYHPLFAEALRHRLQRSQSDLVPALHQRASRWYEQQGLANEAIHHALAAADFEQAVRLIEQNAERLVKCGELFALRSWLEALPEDLVRSRVELSLWHAWLLTQTGQFDAAERLLQEYERHLRPNPTDFPLAAASSSEGQPQRDEPRRLIGYAGRVAATRAYIAFRRGDAPRTVSLARQALEQLPEDQMARGLVAWYLGIAYMWDDDLAAGAAALTEASRISQATGNNYVACMVSYELGQTQARQGHLHQADRSYQQGLDLGEAQGGHLAATGPTYVGRGDLQREWNRLDAAAHSLQAGITQCQQTGNIPILLQGYVALARVRQAQGDAAGTDSLLQQIAQHLRTSSLAPHNAVQFTAWHTRLSLVQGDLALAARWVQERQVQAKGVLRAEREIEYLTLARVLIAQQVPDEALPLLGRLLNLAERQGRMGSALEHLVLQAVAQQTHGDEAGALETLGRALSLAEPEGYIRLFVDEGVPMARLLVKLRAHRGNEQAGSFGYREKLLALLGAASDAGVPNPARAVCGSGLSLVEPLNERELAVLRLIVAGCSNQEIADRLVIAVSTVKWYVNAIYGKLQVESRTKAIVRAMELNIV
jgi:LuxR family maltose regulon positive regulatory protein